MGLLKIRPKAECRYDIVSLGEIMLPAVCGAVLVNGQPLLLHLQKMRLVCCLKTLSCRVGWTHH